MHLSYFGGFTRWGCSLPPERWNDETYSQVEARDLDEAITKIVGMCDELRLASPEVEAFFSRKRMDSDALDKTGEQR